MFSNDTIMLLHRQAYSLGKRVANATTKEVKQSLINTFNAQEDKIYTAFEYGWKEKAIASTPKYLELVNEFPNRVSQTVTKESIVTVPIMVVYDDKKSVVEPAFLVVGEHDVAKFYAFNDLSIRLPENHITHYFVIPDCP